jgi:hypothetical protein
MEPEWTFKKAQVRAVLWRCDIANLCTLQSFCCYPRGHEFAEPGPVSCFCTNVDARCAPFMRAQHDVSLLGQLETMEIYKTVIPQYLLASQKLDFLCFTEGLYKIAERYQRDSCAEDRALW